MRKMSSEIFRMTPEKKRELKLSLDRLVARCRIIRQRIDKINLDAAEHRRYDKELKKIEDMIENAREKIRRATVDRLT